MTEKENVFSFSDLLSQVRLDRALPCGWQEPNDLSLYRGLPGNRKLDVGAERLIPGTTHVNCVSGILTAVPSTCLEAPPTFPEAGSTLAPGLHGKCEG